MIAQLKQNSKTLYDTDYNLWVLETVKKLEKRDYDSIDLENLIEEVLDLSKRDKKRIESLLTLLFEHLLKFGYWKSEQAYNRNHWHGEITNFRVQIKRELKFSPSLKRHLEAVFNECYQDARRVVKDKSQLPLETFPEIPIANVEQILDENWLP